VITRSELKEFLALWRDTPMRYEQAHTASTCNRELAAVHHFLDKAAEWGLIRQNPCEGIKPKKGGPGGVCGSSPWKRRRRSSMWPARASSRS
jgi:hypothetical protein